MKKKQLKGLFILTINDFFTQRVWLDAMGVTKLKAISDMELVFGNNLNNAIYRDELGVRNQREILVFDNCKVEKRFTEVYSFCKYPDSHPPITGPPPKIIIPKTVCAECRTSSSAILSTYT